MKSLFETSLNPVPVQSDETQPDLDIVEMQPLSPPKKVELWSGRFAMVGFVTTVAAIAFRATI
ncbi:MAG: hypothetical protein F6J95_028945 [Leptolyngbya sp. SIO1E4]|nr:hypothetical protein [Leptolyngbya sp. SIO1E4]